jgi:hypothetical protein
LTRLTGIERFAVGDESVDKPLIRLRAPLRLKNLTLQVVAGCARIKSKIAEANPEKLLTTFLLCGILFSNMRDEKSGCGTEKTAL